MIYDLNRNLETVADEMGRTTALEYDSAGVGLARRARPGHRAVD